MLPAELGQLKPNDFSHVDKTRSENSDLFMREFRLLGCQAEKRNGLVSVQLRGQRLMMYGAETSFSSLAGSRLLKNKAMTRDALVEVGLRVAPGRSFGLHEKEKAREYLRKLDRAVVKPVDGNKGRAVQVGVSVEDFDAAWETAAGATRAGVLIEEAFQGGMDARYVVVDGKCVGVMMRVPPVVVGDGIRTIGELIDAKNAQKLTIPYNREAPLAMDGHRKTMLAKRGFSLSSVLAEGDSLQLDSKSSISAGGDAYEITELARPDLKQVAEQTADLTLGLDVIGVDIMARDHFDARKPLDYIVVEVNTRPGIGMHRFPDFGPPNNIHRTIADSCYRKMGFEPPAAARPLDAASLNRLPQTVAADTVEQEEFTLVFGGDTSLGDSYIARQKSPEIKERLEKDPEGFFATLAPVVADASHVVLNFESVLARDAEDPWGGRKSYLGLDDPQRTLAVLQSIGVGSVSLANNHAMDFGARHLMQTRDLFDKAGINTFGAGRDARESSFPLVLSTDAGNIYVFGGFERRKHYHEDYRFYAGRRRPGVQGFSSSADSRLMREIRDFRKHDPGAFIIVYPHWGGGRNYAWANEFMRTANTRFLKSGADLVLGHGAHMMQELWVEDGAATVFSLGNFVFNSPGRYEKADAPPFSLVARLTLRKDADAWSSRLRLYPILSDNRCTGYSPRPVNAEEAAEVFNILSRRGQRIFGQEFSMRRDCRGFFLERSQG